MKSDILLSQYMPVSELVVEQHPKPEPYAPVFDVHTHFGRLLLGDDYDKLYDTAEVVEGLKKRGVRRIVNLDGEYGVYLSKMLQKTKGFEDFILTFGTLDLSGFEDKGFEKYVRQTLAESKEMGIKGLKFWKTLGLVLKDSRGNYIRPDDERLQVIWQTAAELKLPVLIHIADPIAFFKPVDRFNERFEELNEHPDWSFCAPGLYSFYELMEMLGNLLRNNPKTTFIGAHVASCSENLEFVSKYLDEFPNLNVDITMRISELGRQPYTSRKFFVKYQDRILFGTDSTPLDYDNYDSYYRFLETYDEYFSYVKKPIPDQGRWNIYGIGLEPEILEKVYYKNAERIILGI